MNDIAIAGANSGTYTPTQNGIYKVAVYNGTCWSNFSNTYNHVVNSINTPGFENKVSIGPNPVQDVLNIRTSLSSIMEIRVYDLTGKEVVNARRFNNAIDLHIHHLSSGAYVVHIINTRNGDHLQRVIIKR
jgi:hypothetical protein